MVNLLIASLSLSAPMVQSSGPDPLWDDIQLRAVRFFLKESEPSTGFTKDRAANFKSSDNYDIASSASTGFALTAYAIGAERHWIDRNVARERTRITLRNVMKKWAHERGWLYHFVNWKTGDRVWKCESSSIDTSIFLAGMLASEQYWKDPEVSKLSADFVKRIDWKWMLTDGGARPNETIFCMGWHPESGFINARWRGYSEEKMLYIQAYGADPSLPFRGWDDTNRVAVNYKGIDLITGGPLFMHQMSESFYDFSNMRDRRGYNYFVATKNATLANRLFCIDNPGKFVGYSAGFWGLSACDHPDGYSAFGAPGEINDNGTITPTCGLASLRFTPKESRSLAEAMRKTYAASYGRYGYSNGINPSRKWTDPDVIGIDLGMMLCGVENARSGLVNRLSSRHPLIQLGYRRAGLVSAPGSDSGPLRVSP